MTLGQINWRQAFRDADNLPDTATSVQKADRGRALEKILSAMFKESGLDPRLSYRPTGEEIDGSIWLDGRTVLVEAKWTSRSHPASSLYQFKGKVDGNLSGTLGVFISMGGFSTDAVDALVAGKELNIILADGHDIRAVVDGLLSISEALKLKLRAAGDAGTPFLPLTASSKSPALQAGQHLVVVEARSDVRYLELVRIMFGATSVVKFVPAAGPMNMPPLISSMLEIAGDVSAITAIVDGDLGGNFVERLKQKLTSLAAERSVSLDVITVDPDLETALGLADPNVKARDRKPPYKLSDTDLEAVISTSDLLMRANASPPLKSVLKAIGVEVPSR